MWEQPVENRCKRLLARKGALEEEASKKPVSNIMDLKSWVFPWTINIFDSLDKLGGSPLVKNLYSLLGLSQWKVD